MEVIILDTQAYQELLKAITAAVEAGIKKAIDPEPDKWLTKDETKALIGIRSDTTMQKLRDEGALVFTRAGREYKNQRIVLERYLKRIRAISENYHNYPLGDAATMFVPLNSILNVAIRNIALCGAISAQK